MSKVLMLIAQDQFRDEEYSDPKRVLEQAGIQVVTASSSAGSCIGKLGLEAEASISLAEAVDLQWDAVLFIGGAGSAAFFDDEDAHSLARVTHLAGRPVGAICIAPSILAHAGMLEDIRVTSFPSQEEDLRSHGAHYSGTSVEIDGMIVTANGPQSAEAFGEAVRELLGDERESRPT